MDINYLSPQRSTSFFVLVFLLLFHFFFSFFLPLAFVAGGARARLHGERPVVVFSFV